MEEIRIKRPIPNTIQVVRCAWNADKWPLVYAYLQAVQKEHGCSSIGNALWIELLQAMSAKLALGQYETTIERT